MSGQMPPFSVLITRPAGRADSLLAGLDQQEIPYIYQPLITTQQVSIKSKDQQQLRDADLVIFVSVSAVTCLENQMDLSTFFKLATRHHHKSLSKMEKRGP